MKKGLSFDRKLDVRSLISVSYYNLIWKCTINERFNKSKQTYQIVVITKTLGSREEICALLILDKGIPIFQIMYIAKLENIICLCYYSYSQIAVLRAVSNVVLCLYVFK